MRTFRITRLWSDSSGESHFEDIDVPLDDRGAIGWLSARQRAGEVSLRVTDADYDYDWHNAPARQYVVMLSGSVEIEASDGEVRRFGPGDVLLAEDTAGRGHRSRAVDGVRRSMFITLD